MPTFDFIGYTQPETDTLIDKIRPELMTLPFSDDIVFIRHEQGSKVVGLKGGEHPFIRVFTRKEERARLLTQRLRKFADIEIIYIAMFEEKQQ